MDAVRTHNRDKSLVEKWSLGKPEKGIRPGSHTNRDQCLALVPVQAARGPWSIGPGWFGGIRPGSCYEPGLKLPRRDMWCAASISPGS